MCNPLTRAAVLVKSTPRLRLEMVAGVSLVWVQQVHMVLQAPTRAGVTVYERAHWGTEDAAQAERGQLARTTGGEDNWGRGQPTSVQLIYICLNV